MENLTSDQRVYICSCQINFIEHFNLRDHIKKPTQHVIKLFNQKNQKPKRVQRRGGSQKFNFIKSSGLNSEYNNIIVNVINYQVMLFCPKKINFYDFTKKSSIQSIIQFQKLIKQPIIKEISYFKHSKQKLKTQFYNFLKDKELMIHKLFISEENNMLFTAAKNGRIQFFNFETFKLIASLTYHKSPIIALDVCSKYAVSGSFDESICLWSLRTYKAKLIFKGHQNIINSLKLLPNLNLILTGSEDATIRLWNILNKSLVFQINFGVPVRFVSMINKEFFFVGAMGKIIKLNTSMSMIESNFKGVVIPVYLAEEVQTLVTGHYDGSIHFFDSKSLKEFHSENAYCDSKSLKDPHSEKPYFSPVNCISFCKHSKNFATLSMDMILKVWSFNKSIPKMIFCCFKFENFCVSIFKNKIILGGTQLELFDFTTQISAKITEVTKIFAISLSIKLNLVACAHDQVYIFSLKSSKVIKSISLSFSVSYLAFLQSDILCGTGMGEIFLLETPSLGVKSKFLLEYNPIRFLLSSKDWKVFIYSAGYLTKMIETENLKTSVIHYTIIISGALSKNKFVFVDVYSNVYVQENFNNSKSITKFNYRQIYFFPFSDLVLLKGSREKRLIINLATEKITEIKSLKELRFNFNKKQLSLTKEILILSSLDDNYI